MIVIDVSKTIGKYLTWNSGQALYNKYLKPLNCSNRIVLDFVNVRSITVEFITNAFGSLQKSTFDKLEFTNIDRRKEQEIRNIYKLSTLMKV